jgi:ketosteroid isomerase-like protein
MTTEANRPNSEAEIRELLEALIGSVRAKDLAGVMTAYDPKLVAFDIIAPLQYAGAASFVKPWRELFDTFESPIGYDTRDLVITAASDVAFSHSLNRLHGTLKTGQKTDLWLRFTACYRKAGGKWSIVHLHASVPADLKERKAMTSLKP